MQSDFPPIPALFFATCAPQEAYPETQHFDHRDKAKQSFVSPSIAFPLMLTKKPVPTAESFKAHLFPKLSRALAADVNDLGLAIIKNFPSHPF